MNFNLCPSCLADNTEDARFCRRCGHALAPDTEPQPLVERAAQYLPGGLWLDDIQAPPAPPPTGDKRRHEPLRITLRNVQPVVPPPPPPPAPPEEQLWGDPPPPLPPLPPPEAELPDVPELPAFRVLDELSAAAAAQAWPPLPKMVELKDLPTLQLPELRDELPPPAAEPVLPPAPPAPAGAPDLEAKRAARRASVRRSRLRALAQQLTPAHPPEILVVDRNDIERGILCGLLQAFGFGTHAVADAAQALALLDATTFTAVFADIAIDASDGGAGISLARRLRVLQPRPLFVLVSAPLSPIDRVRAELTGCDAIVDKRVTRGSVARVLDLHGIPLPADARRT